MKNKSFIFLKDLKNYYKEFLFLFKPFCELDDDLKFHFFGEK